MQVSIRKRGLAESGAFLGFESPKMVWGTPSLGNLENPPPRNHLKSGSAGNSHSGNRQPDMQYHISFIDRSLVQRCSNE